jgi:hypothetical protein
MVLQGGHLVSSDGGADGGFATATDVLYDGTTMTILEEDAVMCAFPITVSHSRDLSTPCSVSWPVVVVTCAQRNLTLVS